MKIHHLLSCCVLLTGLFLMPQTGTAQRLTVPKWEVRAGIGALPTFLKDHVSTQLPPLSLELRYRPSQRYSVGLLAGRSSSTGRYEHFTGGAQIFSNDFSMVALRGAVHSSPWERWEIYGGMYFGYAHSDITYEERLDKNESEELPVPRVRNGVLFSAFLGTSVKVSGNLRAFGELGYGLSLTTLGMSYRF